MLSITAKIGDFVLSRWGILRDITAVCLGVIRLAVKPGSWVRTVRDQMARQVLFTGVDALGLTCLIAALAGVSVVVQAQLWLGKLGQTEMLGPLLVSVIVREVGPLLVCFMVIGRSGTAIATEVATMRIRSEAKLLDAQGVDPMVYIVMPRVLGMVVSIFCLTVLFVAVSFFSGYIVGFFMGITSGDASIFADSILGAVTPADVWNLLAKTTIPGLLTGVICCMEGYRISGTASEVPQAATRGVVRSIVAVLVVSAIISVFTYV
jgi:phospholipid/cholesterol/gamma-HCH transport system permease protein